MLARAFADANTFLEEADLTKPGCIILDVTMPHMSGLQLQKRLNDAGHPLPIIFISGVPTVEASIAALKGGALDFLLKPLDLGILLALTGQALKRAARSKLVEPLRPRCNGAVHG